MPLLAREGNASISVGTHHREPVPTRPGVVMSETMLVVTWWEMSVCRMHTETDQKGSKVQCVVVHVADQYFAVSLGFLTAAPALEILATVALSYSASNAAIVRADGMVAVPFGETASLVGSAIICWVTGDVKRPRMEITAAILTK